MKPDIIVDGPTTEVPATPKNDVVDRIHDSLDKDTPNRRPVEPKPATCAGVISLLRLGGLQHRYMWRQAA